MDDKALKIALFSIIFLSFNISFAFDANSTHPALTEEIVKFYNSYAERKITKEELELLKEGSKKEDESPRWINHFYDAINNTGLKYETFRGNRILFSLFLKSLPSPPLKSIVWAQDENTQLKYLANRTFQNSIRQYFKDKNQAFISLGQVLHLLEDLGVPEHSRGDSHAGLFNDPKSNYEEYAKYITDNYNLNFAQDLINKKIKPPRFENLDSIFDSLSTFTASNWFSEDTIELSARFRLKCDKTLFYDEKEHDNYYLCYSKSTNLPLLKEYVKSSKITTNDSQIHKYWFNTAIPEAIKYGASLLDLYFMKVKEMENYDVLRDIDRLQQLKSRLADSPNFFTNLTAKSKAYAWSIGERIYTSIASLFKANIQTSIKEDYQISQQVQTTYIERKQENEETKYEERSLKFTQTNNNSSTNQQNTEIITNTSSLNITSTNTLALNTSTEDEIEKEKETEEEIEEKTTKIYYGGGGGRKDICDDYLNKSYPNILISEIQFETKEDKDDEYIELYNPNNEEVDLNCWTLSKLTSNNNEEILIPKTKFNIKIPSLSFILITSSSTKEKYNGDLSYAQSYSISKNNAILLRKPNGEISDLVGYGDNIDKIPQYENKPFIFNDIDNKTIQRLSLKDNNDNSKDFFLFLPTPKTKREDFIDLRGIKIENISANFDEENSILKIQFLEPNIPLSKTENYEYQILFSTSTEFNTFTLQDFGSNSTIPKPQLNNSTFTIEANITKCPSNDSLYYLGIYLYDKLIPENRTDISTTTIDLGDFCINKNIESSTSATKILISEIMISGSSTYDEYIELYNPNNFEVDLTNWRLEKINKNGNITTLISSKTKLSKFDKIKIKPYSYLLIANSSSTLNIQPDLRYSSSYNLAKDNAIRLINDKNEIVDIVGWGDSPIFEKEPFLQNPEDNKAILRKAGISSTEESMKNNEKEYGNSYDTDNNKQDFIISDPEPQNSSSNQEIPPDYITEFNMKIEENIIKINFNSPYQKLPNSYYELRRATSELNDEEIKNNWQLLYKLDINLPNIKPYGEKENIEINACNYDIGIGDYLILAIIENNNLKNFVKGKIENINCPLFKSRGYEKFYWGQPPQIPDTYTAKLAQEVYVKRKSIIKKISIQLAKYMNPNDKLWVEIWKGGQKPEAGELIAKTKEIEGDSLLPETISWIDFNLDQPFILEPGNYFFVLQRSNRNPLGFYISMISEDTDDKSKYWYFVGVEGGWNVKYRLNFTYDLGVIIE